MINAKKKGTDFEREIVKSLKDIDPKIRRSIMSGAIGNILETEKGDLYCPGLNLTIECKRTEKIKPYEFYEQAKEEARQDTIPVVVFRSNNRETLVLLSWDHFRTNYLSTSGNVGANRQSRNPKPTRSVTEKASHTETLAFNKSWQTRKPSKNQA